MKYCCHIGLSRPNCSSMACCWSAFRFSLMNAASGVPGISRNMKNRSVVTASSARALCVKRSTTSLMTKPFPSPVCWGGVGVRALFERSSKTRRRRRGHGRRMAAYHPSVADYRATSPADWGGETSCVGSFGRQLFLLAGGVVELAADHAISPVLEDLLGLRQPRLHLVDRGVV